MVCNLKQVRGGGGCLQSNQFQTISVQGGKVIGREEAIWSCFVLHTCYPVVCSLWYEDENQNKEDKNQTKEDENQTKEDENQIKADKNQTMQMKIRL